MANRVVPDRHGLINIGKLKENLVTEVELPAPGFAGGSYAVLLQRPREKQPYPVTARAEGGRLIWTVQTADTAIPGTGKLECRWYGDNGEVDKSQTYMVRITDGLPDPTEAPEAYAGYVSQVARNAEAAKSAASVAGAAAGRAETALKALEDGIASGDFRGEKGEKGDKGDTGLQGPKGDTGPAGDTTAADAAAEAAKEAAQEAQKAAEDCAGKVNELKSDIAAVSAVCGTLENTEGGTVIQLTDCVDRPLKGLQIFGRTVQDGTPTPEAPVELVSVGDGGSVSVTVCGKNLFYIPSGKTVTKNGVTITAQADGSLLVNGTKTVSNECPIHNEIGSAIPFAGKTITLRSERNDIRVQINVTDKDGTTSYLNVKNGTRTFVIPENATRISWQVSIDGLMSYDNYVVYPYAVFGTEVGSWEPYKAQTLTISTPNGLPGIPVTSGGNYTDANGQQWICDEVDFGRGVYVQRIRKLIPKNLTKGYTSPNGTFLGEYTGDFKGSPTVDTGKIGAVMCDNLPVVTGDYQYHNGGNCITLGSKNINTPSTGYISFDGVKNLEDLNARLAEKDIVVLYALFEEIHIPLSDEQLAAYAALHTYKPNTTIYNDADAQKKVGYQADTKLYIDKQFAELRNAIVSLGGNV